MRANGGFGVVVPRCSYRCSNTPASSWTTLCRGGFGSRRGVEKDATFSKGARKPRSPFESGLPEGQTPRDEYRRPPFWGQKQHVFPRCYIELFVSRARRRLKCRRCVPGPPSPAGEGPDSGRKVVEQTATSTLVALVAWWDPAPSGSEV